MPKRKWLPSIYQDEIVPPARATPADWIIRLDDGAYALAAGFPDHDSNPTRLTDGQEVEFDWTEKHGTAEFTLHEDGTWSMTRPMPTTIGGAMLVAFEGDWDSMADSMALFAECAIDNHACDREEANTVVFYAWSDTPHRFIFRGGILHPAEAVASAEH